MIELSPAAIKEIQRLRTRHATPNSLFRLQVQSGGCAGLAYITRFELEPQSSDRIFNCHGIHVAIDPQTATYFTELTIDFSEDLMGGSFRFHNPNTKKSCDCGVSFSMKER
jgi:iron-sulfur cluster assembly protein